MKKRFDYFLEIAQFPLIALFIAACFIGIGSILVNTQFTLWDVTSKNILIVSAVLKTIGFYIVQFFPLLLLINATNKKFDENISGFLSVCSYFIVLIITMFFASNKLPVEAYSTNIGLSITSSLVNVLESAIRYPLHLGIIITFICYYVVKFAFNSTRNRKSYGLFSFVDKNTASLIITIIMSIIAGIFISYAWFYVVKILYAVFVFVADDITNPFNLFVYGSLEKIFGVLNMNDIPRSLFCFSDFGGSWLDSLGRKYVGDVSIWSAQMAHGTITSGIGRFITPLYIINIFAIPGYLVALFTLYTNRFEKRKYLVLLLLAIIASCFIGNSVPFELFMLCASPLLFVAHIFISGVLYAVLAWMKIYIGYTYAGVVALATPGSLADLFVHFKSSNAASSLQHFIIIGVIIFILYFVITKIYYNYLTIDIFQSGYQTKLIDSVVKALGGINNIKIIDSNILKILVQVNDETKVDVASLRTICFSKVYESKTGYVLYFYKASHVIHSEINKALIKKTVL